jgi:hypothetical protein
MMNKTYILLALAFICVVLFIMLIAAVYAIVLPKIQDKHNKPGPLLSILFVVILISGCGVNRVPSDKSSAPVFIKNDTLMIRVRDTFSTSDIVYIDTIKCPAQLYRDSLIIDTIRIKGKTIYREKLVKVPMTTIDTIYMDRKITKPHNRPSESYMYISTLILILMMILWSLITYRSLKNKD